MSVFRYWRVGLSAAIVLSVSAAFATDPEPPYPECTKKPTRADSERAHNIWLVGQDFYNRGDYDKAIRYWNDALAVDCSATGVLSNIASAQEKKGDRAGAIATLEAYLKRSGPDPIVEDRVRNLKQMLSPAPAPSTSVGGAPAVPSAPATTSVSQFPPPPPPNLPPTEPTIRPYGATPWIVVGAGGVVTIIGGILLPVGYGAISDAKAVCPDRRCPNVAALDKGNTGRAEVGVGWTSLSLGLAAVGGGLAWQFLYNKPTQKPAEPKTGFTIAPILGPGVAGAELNATF